MTIIFFRTIVLYITIIVALRILGKRQIGEMQPSELVITILISEVAAIPMQDNSIPLIYGIISIFTLVALELILSFSSLKSNFVRNALSGKPSLIILNGKIIQSELLNLRFSLDDLFEELRMQQIEKLSDISYGILETNGKFSVSLRAEAQPPTLKDLNIKKKCTGITKNIVKDGQLAVKTIKKMGFTVEEIHQKLHDCGMDAENLYYCTLDDQGNVFEYEEIEE